MKRYSTGLSPDGSSVFEDSLYGKGMFREEYNKPDLFCDLLGVHMFKQSFKRLRVVKSPSKAVSASDSVVAIATYKDDSDSELDGHEVAIKMSIVDQNGMSSEAHNLAFENYAYRTIIQKITEDENDLHFVKWYYSGFCMADIFIKTFNPTTKGQQELIEGLKDLKKLYKEYNNRKDEDDRNLQLLFSITKASANSMSLFNYIVSNLSTLTQKDITSINFQVLHALYTCQLYGLQHNDIHLGNIMVQVNPVESAFHYNIDIAGSQLLYTIPNPKVKILLYDWDRGTSIAVDNEGLMPAYGSTFGYCPDYAQCNGFIPGYDAYTFLQKNVSEKLPFAEIFKLPVIARLSEGHPRSMRPCFVPNPESSKCIDYRMYEYTQREKESFNTIIPNVESLILYFTINAEHPFADFFTGDARQLAALIPLLEGGLIARRPVLKARRVLPAKQVVVEGTTYYTPMQTMQQRAIPQRRQQQKVAKRARVS